MARKVIVTLVLFTLLVGLPFVTPAADAPESQGTQAAAASAPGTQEVAGAAAASAPTKQEATEAVAANAPVKQESGAAAANNAPEKQDAAGADGSNEAIGNDDDSKGGQGFAEAAPVGGPVPEGTFPDAPTADTTTATTSSHSKSGATTLEVSTILATMAGFSWFYF